MAPLGGFFEEWDEGAFLEAVSKLPPKDVLSYLIEVSKRVLAVYARMRDSLPKGYGWMRFSEFVETKGKQVEKLCKIALRLFPEALSSEVNVEKLEFSVKTVGDYVEVLRETIRLEELQLRACRYLEGHVENQDMKAILSDLAEEIELNIRKLEEELERVEKFERKTKFSEFVKELVGDRDG
ncbi:hypothetical protein [Thermococcus henrietii]|uniref:hypothetical protein n=1 Tax=Thermococcus henrietii TaxID=2016361 RepID=UPI000C07A580|nr:hypothetical protein [Thermococcus henrietii]